MMTETSEEGWVKKVVGEQQPLDELEQVDAWDPVPAVTRDKKISIGSSIGF